MGQSTSGHSDSDTLGIGAALVQAMVPAGLVDGEAREDLSIDLLEHVTGRAETTACQPYIVTGTAVVIGSARGGDRDRLFVGIGDQAIATLARLGDLDLEMTVLPDAEHQIVANGVGRRRDADETAQKEREQSER